MKTPRQFAIAVLLTFLGTIKVVADVLDFETVSGVVAATNVSPAMKVFTAHKGYETFSSKFKVSVRQSDGQTRTLWLTPKTYRKLNGPYNRRNVFGAVLAYGPVLVTNKHTQPMWEAVVQRGFCDSTQVLRELNVIDSATQRVSHIKIDYIAGRTAVNDHFLSSLEHSCE